MQVVYMMLMDGRRDVVGTATSVLVRLPRLVWSQPLGFKVPWCTWYAIIIESRELYSSHNADSSPYQYKMMST